MTTREAYIALNMIDGVGPATFARLMETFHDASAILHATVDQLMRVPDIGESTAVTILDWENKVDLSKELLSIENAGCHIVLQNDEEYPPLLRQIYNPPILLYVKGKILPQDKSSIAIVGSRLTTLYGLETAQNFSRQLAYAGVTIVSGGAHGIDTAAHRGALSAKGRTLAVLGNGINIVYPAENAHLFEQIAENGALISQFPMNRRGDRQTYPIRNRIVAGSTLGTVVIEADINSGALITANMAVDLNRQVFAVPGRIDSPRSRGCHKLIKEGAKLCENVQDILCEFECLRLSPHPQPSPKKPNRTSPQPQTIPATHANPAPPMQQNELPFSLPTTATENISIHLSDNESAVLACITTQEQHVDEIIRASGLACNIVQAALFALELKKQIQQLPGKLYRKRI